MAVPARARGALEQLQARLVHLASEGFAVLATAPAAGAALRDLADEATRALGADAGALRAWADDQLGDFDAAPLGEREVRVARGLRLVASLAPPRKARAAPRPRAVAVAPAFQDPLASSPRLIKGIGPAFAAAMAERGLVTVEDLLWLLPRRYDDARQALALAALTTKSQDGDRVVVRARVRSAKMMFVRGRRWCDVRFLDEHGGRGELVVRWFGIRGPMDKRFPAGAIAVLSGKRKDRGGVVEMANPDVLSIELPGAPPAPAPGIIPRYADIPGLPPARLRAACAAACAQFAGAVDDGVPPQVLAAFGLAPLAEALRHLHAPPATLDDDAVRAMHAGQSPWHRRLAFGELFVLGAAVARRRAERAADRAEPFVAGADLGPSLAGALPFAPTGAQRRALAEVGADLARATPMNRLLQGDVGSGKTAVLFGAALQVVRAGGQAAIMAPTELLAEQHARTLGRWAEAAGLRLALLTASTPKPVRATQLALLVAGELDVVVGTHALLSEGVQFARLGLVVIDEQHRFGVAQRVRLRTKGDVGAPHLLVVTATPIPRTLALSAYGDLDVSTLDELPPGRAPTATDVVRGARADRAIRDALDATLAAGQRAYVVCPLVEPADATDDVRAGWADATTMAARLGAALAPRRVGLVHGRQDARERDATMAAFRDGGIEVLVATTVIEVGVDVPEATLIVIDNADHFGLAQLHQLRGRVGRGREPGRCLLVARGEPTELGAERLAAMAATTDGFRIAERDLELRGPGELLGARQAGLPQLRFGDIATHTALLLEARQAAQGVLAADLELALPAHANLAAALRRRGVAGVYGAEGG
jgi:ATP-dependent DNA helicase RecG